MSSTGLGLTSDVNKQNIWLAQSAHRAQMPSIPLNKAACFDQRPKRF